jgi:hypothetical protein
MGLKAAKEYYKNRIWQGWRIKQVIYGEFKIGAPSWRGFDTFV